MAISIFPSTAAEFVSNNFVIDMNDTSNNTADTGGVKQAGPYSMSFSSGDSSFDVYLIDDEGNSVGYSNSTSINASGLFSTVVILGVAQDEVISFTYQGSVNNADGEGDEPGAGAYLESISPSDLPSIDDTATVTGGNFGADTEITFESGATVLPAKSITVVSGTELLVTRPDGLIEDDAPYTVRAVTNGVPEPSGSNANLLIDQVTAGSDPTWVTTSPLNEATPGVSFSQTLTATDSDGTIADYSVTAGTITPGLSLDSSTGVLSGTPTTGGNFVFTVTATDDGGNETAKEFEHPVQLATGGTITDDNGFRYHTFTSTDDFIANAEIVDAEYLVVAGGAGGGDYLNSVNGGGGGGGGGGLSFGTATISAGTTPISIGAGGGRRSNGSNSSISGIVTASGGGTGGGPGNDNGASGGSGGGGGDPSDGSGGAGTAGQGNSGGNGDNLGGGGGGGAGSSGGNSSSSSPRSPGNGGAGLEYSVFATATSTGDSGFYAGGGGGGCFNFVSDSFGGAGGGGNGGDDGIASVPGQANTGGGGGGSGTDNGSTPAGSGGSGVVIVRYAF